LNDCKKAKCLLLAPARVKILLYWGSVQEIEANDGTLLAENAKCFRSKKISTL